MAAVEVVQELQATQFTESQLAGLGDGAIIQRRFAETVLIELQPEIGKGVR